MILLSFLTPLVLLLQVAATSRSDLIRILGPQGVNLHKLEARAARQKFAKDPGLLVQEAGGSSTSSEFRPLWFKQPLDHFSTSNKHTFHQRYWVNTRHYKPSKNAPVIVLDGGETSGEDRLPFLDTGIVEILAKATGGVGVVLEHRYYGKSIPVSNFSTDSLRWLNNAQSAADSANFMRNFKIDGIEEDLRAPHTPWIYYGGSYAGARAAHMKVLYPDLAYGAISSSGVTHATLQNWQYMEVIRTAADAKCSFNLVNSIERIDAILAHSPNFIKRQLKGLFGLQNLQNDDDFASMIETPLSAWQAKCWDPLVGSNRFDEFCDALSKPFGRFSSEANELPFGHEDRMVTLQGGLAVDLSIVRYGRWIKEHYVSKCPEEFGVEDCFGTYNDEKYQATDLSEDWRLWLFQVCTEWGYFTTAPPDQKHPRIVSNLLSLAYETKICKQAFLPGEHFSIPKLPNVTVVNELGDFDIAADRLAIIDGEVDPWRPVTPHGDDAEDRKDTILRPFKLIPRGVHHYDEYGLRNLLEEPPEIRKIHGEMITFVTAWLKDWEEYKKINNTNTRVEGS